MQEWAPSIAVAAGRPQQVGESLNRHISRREGVKHCWIVRITTLPREQGRVANIDQKNNRVRGRHSKPPQRSRRWAIRVTTGSQRVHVNEEILVYWSSAPSRLPDENAYSLLL